ncbi:MAG: hypothetical protein A2046_13850 [Bacteroidetes bacterium GWA2_30_7]|nr:MAG: hypothetical protein A2046_13850 [Bacteroidetes bacterium GWA2_30_7]
MLKRLYSETNLLLKDFTFEPGINIILGKYSGLKEATGVNGIGKSSLIRLIDFALLSDSAEKLFFSDKYKFLKDEKHNIVLEFLINKKKYFIKRYFEKKDEIYFGTTPKNLEKYDKTELKKTLTNIFFPTVNNDIYIEGSKFRTLMNFFIKDDLDSHRRYDPLNFVGAEGINKTNIAIFNFFLLNLPTRNLLSFAEVAKEIDNKNKAVKEIERTVEAETGKKIEEFHADKIKIEKGIALIEKSLNDYKFLENYKNIESELIEITRKINEKLEEHHALNMQLKKIRDNFTLNQNIDTAQIQKIYNETLYTLGDLVKKSLDSIIQFKSELLENRNKFLIKKENQLQSKIDEILNHISVFEKERSILYQKLKEKGALDSIENAYKDLISEKTKLLRIDNYTEQVDNLKQIVFDLEVTVSELRRSIINDLNNYNKQIDTLQRLFHEILEHAIFIDEENENAYFIIEKEANTKSNQVPFKIQMELPKADALGNFRLKIIVYDLMVYLNNIKINRELPDFLIHDGVFHAISKKTMINTLNYVFRQYNTFQNFQYFLTFNEDEIDTPTNKSETYGSFEFDWRKHVVAEFSDVPEKMLFKKMLP